MHLLALALTATLSVAHAESTSWNQFRGPNGSGVASNCQPPRDAGKQAPTWSMAVPPGHSSPVLSADKVFLTAIDGDTLITLSFSQSSGEELWRAHAPKISLEAVHATSSPAAASPYVDSDRVIVYFGSYGLLCYDHNGKELWKRPIETPKSLYGMSSSPIVYQNTVILALDDERTLPDSKLTRSKILAVDKRTGETAWEAPRPLLRSGWSTPVLWHHDTTTDLVLLGEGRLCGYDAETGIEKWFVNGFSRETIALPIVGNGFLYASAAMLGGVSDESPDPEPFWNALLPFDTNKDGKLERSEMIGDFTYPLRPDLPIGHPGFGIPVPTDPDKAKTRIDGFHGWVDKDKDGYWTKEELITHLSFDRGKPTLLALRPGGEGDISKSHVAWSLHRNIPEIPSPVFYQNRLYLIRDGGVMSAINATNGETLYKNRLGASGHYRASPVIADDHVYIISNEGVLSVVPAEDTFEVIHQHDFKESVNATPAIDTNAIYIRTESTLYAFRN